MSDCDPVVEGWLRAELGDSFMAGTGADRLNLLALAIRRDASGDIPDDVLVAWHRMLARARITLKQSEVSFIEGARQEGWSETRIAESLGLGDAERVMTYHQELLSDLERSHPSVAPKPWTG